VFFWLIVYPLPKVHDIADAAFVDGRQLHAGAATKLYVVPFRTVYLERTSFSRAAYYCLFRLWSHPRAQHIREILLGKVYSINFAMGSWGHWCQKQTTVWSNQCLWHLLSCCSALLYVDLLNYQLIVRVWVGGLYRKFNEARRSAAAKLAQTLVNVF
jgi:hypothetical protein